MNKTKQLVLTLSIFGFIMLGSAGVFYFHFSDNKSSAPEQLKTVQSDLISSDSQTEYSSLSQLSDQELLAQLESNLKVALPKEDYAITADVVEEIEQRHLQVYAKNDEYVPPDKQNRGIASTGMTTSMQNEDLKLCNDKRKFYEKQIVKSKKIKGLLADVPELEVKLSKMCITHIMNKFSVSKSNYAYCTKSKGAVVRPAVKPCITDNLVNLTYNSYMDVTDCLNLDPKLLLPKIGSESGFFINTVGSGLDGGLGQLTRPAIAEVNNHIDHYLSEIEKAAQTKPSCARIMKYKSFFAKVPEGVDERCSVIGLPENPLKNILYMALLNRINMDQISGIKFVAGHEYVQSASRGMASVQNNNDDEFGGAFKAFEIKEKLIQLGIKKPNMHYFKEVILLIGYNTGVHTAVNILKNYLDLRIQNKLKLSMKDFDFNNPKSVKDDLTGEVKDVVSIARSYIMSSFVSPRDSDKDKNIKVKRRKMLPKLWAEAYNKTFPEFLAYKANSYTGKSTKPYSIYGFPGYLNVVAEQNKAIRDEFTKANFDPNLCTDPNFLKMKN